MEEVLLIDKPEGWTSFDVVAKVRGNLQKKTGLKIKVGHAGTLDPFATGLLIVLIGAATKKQDKFMKQDKEYVATLELGKVSSTGDPEGDISSTGASVTSPSKQQIQKVLNDFTGEIEQIPPRHSAIKINGQRAYKLARQGKDFVINSRLVKVHELEPLDYNYPFLKIRVSCSSGTYIRSLACDLGQALKTGAYLTQLRRTKIGNYSIDKAQSVTGLDINTL